MIFQPTRVAVSGAGIALAAGLVFVFGDGLFQASALIVGIFTGLVTVGVLIGCFVEQGLDGVLGFFWRVFSRLELRRRDRQATSCALCRKPLEVAGSIVVCLECDLLQVSA